MPCHCVCLSAASLATSPDRGQATSWPAPREANNLFSDVPEGLSLGTALSMCQGKKKKKKTQFSAYHPLLEGFPGGSDGEESAK